MSGTSVIFRGRIREIRPRNHRRKHLLRLRPGNCKGRYMAMALRFPLFTLLVVLPAFAGEWTPVVKSVAVPGTGLAVKLATQAGQAYDAGAVEKDVRYLWGLGQFEDIRVEASDDADGTAVVFHATPSQRPRLHEIRIEPSTFGLEVK